MRMLFIGDIVGTPGVNAVKAAVPALRLEHGLDFVIANAENAAAGSGLFPSNFHSLRKAGVDGFTMGDHIYRRAESLSLFKHGEPIARPANFPADAPGLGYFFCRNERGQTLAVASIIGRLFMKPADCPLRALDALLPTIRQQTPCIFVDYHAEATGEKYTAKHYFDGRISAMVGTHTHVPTADAHITANGTAFMADVGMTGGHAGILGRRAKPIVDHALDMVPNTFDVEENDPRLDGVILEFDESTGKAVRIQPLVWSPGVS